MPRRSMTPDQRQKSARRAAANRAALRAIVLILGSSVIGLVGAFLLLANVVLPVFGLGTVNRIAELGRHLDQPFSSHPIAVCLGSSITLEGVDARIVTKASQNRWQVENLALSGCTVGEFPIVLPKLLDAKPDVVVLPFLPPEQGRLHDLNLDKAFAFAYAGFVKAWPPSTTQADFPGISQESYAALRSTTTQQQLHFRTVPTNALNQGARKLLRSGLRDLPDDDWTAPFEMLESVIDERLDNHISEIEGMWRKDLAGGRPGKAVIRAVVRQVAAGGARPLLVALPVHPRLQAEFQPAIDDLASQLNELAAQNNGEFIDASKLLTASEFADGIHPNAEGRRKYSERIGEVLGRMQRDPS
jgi:hypothetical protein